MHKMGHAHYFLHNNKHERFQADQSMQGWTWFGWESIHFTPWGSISPFSSIYIKYHLSNFTNFTNLYSLIRIETINWASGMPKWNQDSKPQFTHKNQINFTMCIHIFMSILVNPNQYSQICKVSQLYNKVAYNKKKLK